MKNSVHLRLKSATIGLPGLVLLMVLVWQPNNPAVAHAQPQSQLDVKNILILNAFQSNLPANVKTAQGITSSLSSGGVDVKNQFFEYLDLPRNPSPEHMKVLAELMRSRYSQRRIDLIITQYPGALQFLLNEGRTVFPEVPILALHMFPRIELPKTGRLIIQHSNKIDIIGTVESALKLVPGAKRVYVVGGVSSVDRTLENQARRDSKKWDGQLDFRYLSDMSFEVMLSEVSSAPPGTIVLFTVLTADITGKAYIPRDVVQRLSQVSKAPIFGLYDTLLGYGIAGGFLADFEYIGTKAGELALNILTTGSSPDKTSATLDVPTLPMFDWRQLKHWDLSEAALPKGSIVINREVTIWDFRYYIIGALAFIFAETALILFLVVQRHRKKAAEESLRNAEEKYRNIFEGSMEGIFETSPQGQPFTANPALARILGYDSPDEFISFIQDSAHQIFADPDKRAEYVGALEKQDVVLGFECELLRRDGTKIWASLNSRRVCGLDGKTLFYSGFLEDITARKRGEAEVDHVRTELLRVERLSSLGELTASLAHELNQPLAAILSSAQAALRFLRSATPDLNLFRTILQNIIEDDKRAAGVITSLRSMMKREVREREPLNLNTVLDDVLKLFSSEAIVRNVTIERNVDSSLPPVLGDKIQLQQVVLNLIMNAADAMSESPHEQEKRKIILRTQATDHGIQAAVRDFGSGIDPAKLADIWQPFFTTKSTGLGMGLSVSHSIIQAHGGRIWAENHPDGGAMFTFEIPVARNQ